jgi:hypothetical protein
MNWKNRGTSNFYIRDFWVLETDFIADCPLCTKSALEDCLDAPELLGSQNKQ